MCQQVSLFNHHDLSKGLDHKLDYSAKSYSWAEETAEA